MSQTLKSGGSCTLSAQGCQLCSSQLLLTADPAAAAALENQGKLSSLLGIAELPRVPDSTEAPGGQQRPQSDQAGLRLAKECIRTT